MREPRCHSRCQSKLARRFTLSLASRNWAARICGHDIISFFRKLEPYRAVMLAAFGPVLAHLHEQEEMHAPAEDVFHLLAAPLRRSL